MMHPYVSLTLTDYKGNTVDYKPEYINSKNLEITAKGSMGTSNKVTYGIENYNAGDLSAFN